MTQLVHLADVLRAAGLTVVELAGWQSRGENYPFDPIGLLLHHDAMGLGWNDNPGDDMNVPEYMSQDGVDGSQLWVRKDGAWVVLAAGCKWHAGTGSWPGVPGSGNTYLLGIETDHTIGDPWPDVQVQSIDIGSRALYRHYGMAIAIGHKEWAPARKIDPENFNLDAWRSYIRADNPPPPHLVSPSSPATPATPQEELTMASADCIVHAKTDGGAHVYGLFSGGKIIYIDQTTTLNQLRDRCDLPTVAVSQRFYNSCTITGKL